MEKWKHRKFSEFHLFDLYCGNENSKWARIDHVTKREHDTRADFVGSREERWDEQPSNIKSVKDQ